MPTDLTTATTVNHPGIVILHGRAWATTGFSRCPMIRYASVEIEHHSCCAKADQGRYVAFERRAHKSDATQKRTNVIHGTPPCDPAGYAGALSSMFLTDCAYHLP